MMMCSTSNADIVYNTEAGTLGFIKTTSSTSADFYGTQYTGTGSGAFLGSYWNGSSTKILTVSGDSAMIFNPADLTAPETNIALSGISGVQAMAGSDVGRSVFLASGSTVTDFSTEDFSAVHSYDHEAGGRVTALLTNGSNVYAAVDDPESGDIILIFDGQLRDDVQGFARRDLPSGTTSLSWLNGSRIAIGHASGVDVWHGTKIDTAASSDAPVKSVCQDSGDGFYFAEQSASGDVYTTTLKHYADGEITTLFTDSTGKGCQVLRHEDNNILAAVIGGHVRLYGMEKDSLIGDYDSTALGGKPINVAISAVSGDDGSSSSGCNVSGLGGLMLIGCLAVMKRRHYPKKL